MAKVLQEQPNLLPQREPRHSVVYIKKQGRKEGALGRVEMFGRKWKMSGGSGKCQGGNGKC